MHAHHITLPHKIVSLHYANKWRFLDIYLGGEPWVERRGNLWLLSVQAPINMATTNHIAIALKNKSTMIQKILSISINIRNHYPHTNQILTCHRCRNRHSPSSKWACKKKLACEFSLPPFLLSPKIKNFRGPHCLVELSSELKRKSNKPIMTKFKS